MCARSSIKSSSAVVVALVLMSGCSPERDEIVLSVTPEPPAPELAPEPAPEIAPAPAPDSPRELLEPAQTAQNRIANSAGTVSAERLEDAVPREPRRLVFQCADDLTFAVQTTGVGTLEVFPPGLTLGYIVLAQQPTESGMLYRRDNAEFRSDGELATLILGNERYVDCVAHPAAAVWEAPSRPGAVR